MKNIKVEEETYQIIERISRVVKIKHKDIVKKALEKLENSLKGES